MSTLRRLPALLLLLLAACAQAPSAPSTTPSTSASPTPSTSLSTFVESLKAAKYSDFAPPASKVESEAAFEGMRRYLLDRYEHAQSPRTFDQAGATYDCLPATTPAATPASASPCPSGYAPERRLTLADLTRFPTLQAYLARNPGGGKVPPTPPPT